MSASNYFEEKIGNHIFRTDTLEKPSALYIALFTTLPSEDGTGGVEIVGNGYARVGIVSADSNWTPPNAGDGKFSNAIATAFPLPTADWGTVNGYGIYDASSAGNMWFYAPLTTPKNVTTGFVPVFVAGELTITIS